MKTAVVAKKRLRVMLDPLNLTRFAKQCPTCNFCMVRIDYHLCLLGIDLDCLDPCYEMIEKL